MAKKQKIFWISKKTTYGTGPDALSYGDEVGDKIPAELIKRHKERGEVGSVEMAIPDNVSVDELSAKIVKLEKELKGRSEALEKSMKDSLVLKEESKTADEKLIDYSIVFDEVLVFIGKDKPSKDEKAAMVKSLEDLKPEEKDQQ